VISSPPTGELFSVLLGTLLAAALLWGLPIFLVRRTQWTAPVQATAISVFHGPLLAAVLAGILLELDGQFWSANPGALPALLAPAAVAVIAELAVIWTVVGTATLAVRRHVISERERSGRFLVYGIFMAGLLGVVVALLSSPEVPRLAGGIWAVIGFASGLLVTYLTVHTVNVIAQRYFEALAHRRSQLETIYRFLRRALLGTILLLGVAVSTYVNFPSAAAGVTSLLLAAGFLSIVVGLAAQSTLSNIIAGAMVSLAQPFEIGDAVVFPYPNGDWCFVEDIQLTYTVLRTWDLRRLMVPNSMFQSNVIVNYTAVDPTMLVIVSLDITYESDVDRAREVMLEEARKHPDFRALGNLPITHVMEYDDNGVQLRLLAATKDQPTAFQMEKDLLYSIRRRFGEIGVQLPYPTRRVILEKAGPSRSARKPRGEPAA
jgi:small conductance mechanosensitive channel